MQSARIWFRQSNPAVTLAIARTFLQSQGAQVRETAWTLGPITIPQLLVTDPLMFLMQLNDDEYIVEEAEEAAGFAQVPEDIRAKVAMCDARFEMGDTADEAVMTDQGLFVTAGWTGFDPGQTTARRLLRTLATKFDAVLEDNVNGTWWVADSR